MEPSGVVLAYPFLLTVLPFLSLVSEVLFLTSSTVVPFRSFPTRVLSKLSRVPSLFLTTFFVSLELPTVFPDESFVFESMVVEVWVLPPETVVFLTSSLISVELTALPSASFLTLVVVLIEPLPMVRMSTTVSEEPVSFPFASLETSVVVVTDPLALTWVFTVFS